jgi:hypothetical protein
MNWVISVGCGRLVVARESSRYKMCTEITRQMYEGEGQRYASELTDAEWALIEPHMPAAKRLGRPRATELPAYWTRSCISRGPAVSGECCQRISRRRLRAPKLELHRFCAVADQKISLICACHRGK